MEYLLAGNSKSTFNAISGEHRVDGGRSRRIGVVLAIEAVLFLSAAVLAAGILLSLLNDNWTWFSRSGSLLVATGVSFAFLTSANG